MKVGMTLNAPVSDDVMIVAWQRVEKQGRNLSGTLKIFSVLPSSVAKQVS